MTAFRSASAPAPLAAVCASFAPTAHVYGYPQRFILMLRLYRPKEKDPSILDGTWKPPVVKKAS